MKLRTFVLFAFFSSCLLHEAQAQSDSFRWMDFHSEKDQSEITWVTRALSAEKWTAIREIGVIYDSALVVTTNRASAQSPAQNDTFTVWSVNLTTHQAARLVDGSNLRWLDWMRFRDAAMPEPAILYDSCTECSPDTYLTSFYFDFNRHAWAARWMRGNQAVPLTEQSAVPGVTLTQVYALMAEPNGREFLATWNHLDYGKAKPAEDALYQYDQDPVSGLDRMAAVTGKQAEALKQRMCRWQEVIGGVGKGQDSALCGVVVPNRPERHPVTTPPANNHGQMALPAPRHH